MEDNFYNPQNIEAYLRGKLSKTDRELFENDLAKDPLLKNELSLQKDIISSLKEHRKDDLKRRLNAIEIRSPWYYGAPLKVAASFSTIAVITLLSYFGYNTIGDKKSTVAVVQERQTTNEDAVSKKASRNVKITQEKKNTVETNSPNLNSSSNRVLRKEDKQKIHSKEESPTPLVPAVNDNYNEEAFNPDHNLKIPEGNVVPANDHKTSDIQVQIASTTEHKFHYQFFNNKLFLFCDFSSGPYELLELHNKKSRDLYLFYNDNYYEIKHNQHEVTPLRQIKSSNLIKQLGIIKDK